MKFLFVASVLFLAACSPSESHGQVDPFWLKSWNGAQKKKPEIMASSSRIAPAGEPGTPLVIHGQIFKPDGKTPAQGIVVHSYHRDQAGFDFGPNDNSTDTWRLQGWVKTDADGRFEFQTIRPAPDRLGRDGAHVHLTLESQDFGRQWAPIVYFSDDPLVTKHAQQESAKAGEFGWVRQVKTIDGTQHIEVRIRLKEKGEF